MALDIGTLVAKVKVDDSDFDSKTSGWSTKGAAVGSAFGNIAADAISQASSMLVSFVGDAASASDATDKFKKTLEFAGLDTSNIDALVASTQAYADQTVYSLGDIQNITAQLTANSIPGADGLAMALGNLNAIAGGNAETFGRVGTVLTQTAANGKLTTENWQQMAEAIPGASGALQTALMDAGAYTGNFRDAMSEGQITAEEFNAALMLVGTDPIAVEAAKSTETFEGAAGNLAASIQTKLVQALEIVKPAITGFQNGLAWFIANLGEFTPLLAGLGVALAVVLAPAIWAAVAATGAWTLALLANPMTWIVLAIVALVAAIVWLIQNWDTAVAFITEIWGGFIGWITGVIDGFVGWWNGVWEGFASWIVSVWEGFVGFVSDVFRNFVLGIQIIGNAVAAWWNGLWAGIGQFFSDTWNNLVNFGRAILVGYISFILSIVNGFVSGWNAVWSRVGQIIGDVWNNIVGFFQGIPGTINNLLSGAGQWLYSIGRDIIDGLWRGLKSIWSSVSSWFESTFGGIIDTVAGIFGIASPSKVFRAFGINIGEGLIDGLSKMEDPIDREFRDMLAVPPVNANAMATSSTPVAVTKSFTYVAAEHQSLSSQEALFAALGSPRAQGDGSFLGDN